MLGIQCMYPNWTEILKSCESFLRKSQFSTLTDLNPGFGRLWDMLGIYFIFKMLQKKSFGQNNFWISCTISKVQFWVNFQFWMNTYLVDWNAKLERAYYFIVHYLKKPSVLKKTYLFCNNFITLSTKQSWSILFAFELIICCCISSSTSVQINEVTIF